MRFEPVPVPLRDMRAWCAKTHGFSFVITLEQQQRDPNFTGYNASWKRVRGDMRPALPGLGGEQPANRIEGGPWKTFGQAEAACRAALMRLRRAEQ